MARLLEMLSEWFSYTLGRKLLDHLQEWVNKDVPAKGMPSAWKPQDMPALASHLMDLFHLLPQVRLCVFVAVISPPALNVFA